jgi:flavodoxin
MTNNLVIYYSRKGQNYFGGSIRSVPKGNTEYVAEFIAQAIEADIFEVDTLQEYSTDYTTCTEEAKAELRANARPELKTYIDSIDQYDNIFICGPCWWGTYPMAIFSQIEKLNWEGKKVYAVMTHEGSGLGSSERDLGKYCKGAKIIDGLAISGSSASNSQKKVADWAKKVLQ